MATEIEKKYRVTEGEAARLRGVLRELGARDEGEVFEVNTLYAGNGLDTSLCALRLRQEAGRRALLTYKERPGSEPEAVKRRHEIETEVADAGAASALLEALGYRAALVYEKRRATYQFGEAEVVLDELPFGWFVEIEGEEIDILDAERRLELTTAEHVHETYPELTVIHGLRMGDAVEARFQSGEIGNV
ncbi:MAG TPA: class IV adenylate cyclase [Pyrinomonadaceae bacterium]|nr:class IV adenylate cyclase [Pyrinomonadaceae bacterium]